MIEKAVQIERVRKLLAEKAYASFFGELVIRMEHGNIVYIVEDGTFRVPEARGEEMITPMPTGAREVSLKRINAKDGDTPMALVRIRREGRLRDMVPSEPDEAAS